MALNQPGMILKISNAKNYSQEKQFHKTDNLFLDFPFQFWNTFGCKQWCLWTARSQLRSPTESWSVKQVISFESKRRVSYYLCSPLTHAVEQTNPPATAESPQKPEAHPILVAFLLFWLVLKPLSFWDSELNAETPLPFFICRQIGNLFQEPRPNLARDAIFKVPLSATCSV